MLLPPGEEGAAEDGKDSKSAKAKRSHFGRAVSLKNFIMRKGKSTSVDLGEGTKEEGAPEGEEAAGTDGEAAATATAAEETNDEAGEKAADAAEADKTTEAEKTPAEAPVTNGENGCSNGTVEEHGTHNHQEEAQEEEEKKTTGGSPVKKTKEAGAKEEANNAKIINATAAVNSGEFEQAERDSDAPQNGEGDANNTQQQQQPPPAQSDVRVSVSESGCRLVGSGEGGDGGEGAPHNGGCDDAESCDLGGRERREEEEQEQEEEEMRKRDLRDAAVAIVQNVMSAATDQLERELCVDNGLNGCYDNDG